jgi:hypothetical protein
MTDIEIWRTVADYPDYSVSNHGRVRRDTAAGGTYPGKLLKLKSTGRYLYVTFLDPDGRHRTQLIHRLVLAAFVGDPPTSMHQGAHWDGNTSNNRTDNLRWATPKENMEDRNRHGRTSRGHGHSGSALEVSDILAIREMRAAGHQAKVICDRFKLPRHVVTDICVGRSWMHVGGPITKLAVRHLSVADVADIRVLAASGATNMDIAERFSTTPHYVSRILRGNRRSGVVMSSSSDVDDPQVIGSRRTLDNGP